MDRAAAFDFDGTLFETMRIEYDAFNTALGSLGLSLLDEAGVARFIGMRMEDIPAILVPGHMVQMRQILYDRILEEELNAMERSARLYEGVAAMLSDLYDRGVTLYICSNGTEAYLQAACEKCGIARYFVDIRHAGNCASKAAAVKAIAACHDVMTFAGDREEDAAAAKEAGCISIACLYGYGGGKDFGADYRAHDIKELHCAIIKALRL